MTPPGRLAGSQDSIGYGPPRSYEELRAVLSSGSIKLPKRLQQIAVYLWQHPGEVAVGSIATIADRASVPPSAMVRFAQALGFSGFSDLQALFKDHLVEGATTADGGGPGSRHRLVGGFVAAARRSLSALDQSFDEAAFETVVSLIARAETIYLVGSKRAFPVATYLSSALAQQGVKTILVDNLGSLGFDQIGSAGPRDAVLAINFSPYNSITPDLVSLAKSRGAHVAAITDSTFSPLVPLADGLIEVVESDFVGFRSLAATLTIAMAVVQGVAAARDG